MPPQAVRPPIKARKAFSLLLRGLAWRTHCLCQLPHMVHSLLGGCDCLYEPGMLTFNALCCFLEGSFGVCSPHVPLVSPELPLSESHGSRGEASSAKRPPGMRLWSQQKPIRA